MHIDGDGGKETQYMKKILIIGGGGFGREVQWLIERINEKNRELNHEDLWEIQGYVDITLEPGTEINGYKVLGGTDYLLQQKIPLAAVCAIGASQRREKVIKEAKANKYLYFPNLVDPSAKMSDYVEMGEGNIICAGNILTVNIKISDFCIINLDCTVGHDAILEPFTTVYPSVNISGNVKVERGVEIGTGTQIIQGKTIGTRTIIGAGAVVVKDIPKDCTAVGNPCKPIKYHNNSNS